MELALVFGSTSVLCEERVLGLVLVLAVVACMHSH